MSIEVDQDWFIKIKSSGELIKGKILSIGDLVASILIIPDHEVEKETIKILMMDNIIFIKQIIE